ncbi:MAG: preprotein translocase subunit SecA [Candidatus Wallbacteria bacterium]|nr:preprotein translocase subunit SecA [Candidatus Wallbacteria bacterium]
MLVKLLRYLFNKNDREIRRYQLIVDQINSFEEELKNSPDDGLKERTVKFRARLQNGEKLDDLLPEAFALVREASRRVIGLRHFDVQLMGGIALHEGRVIEMKTGEGKTLVATLPAYLNGLLGKGVHIITVNDYLAQRDREWMGKIYEFLGLAVDVILHAKTTQERKKAYEADIVYGTNSEFGFDYLRDNMVIEADECVQNLRRFAIVDEVDSILIDEARTPLIISGPAGNSRQQYFELKPLVHQLVTLQKHYVDRLMEEARKLMDEGKTEEGGMKLLLVSKGDPKNKQLFKLFEDAAMRKLVEGIELEVIREKRTEVYDDLYYQVDERGHNIDLTDKGRYNISQRGRDMFTIPDLMGLQEEILGIRNRLQNQDTTAEEKEKLHSELLHKEESFAIEEKKYHQASERIHNVSQLLKAYALFERDVDYVVQENKVLIVDEFTGRLMPGRRYSDGLHQALEAKEAIKIEGETQTLATITLQNYFRLYEKLSGMTGTAATEAAEFLQIYKMDTVVVPTNQEVIRVDHPDAIYKTEREKYEAIIRTIVDLHKKMQPVLVGTTSIEKSERIGSMLSGRGVTGFHILNAKYHAQEAEIIAKAGEHGAITIATNMAGRGTDIVLDEGARKAGGLFVLGTERHESRRIDNQLRGRCGRQGDAGASQFVLSLEDDLLRLFGGDNLVAIMEKMGMEENVPIEHRLVSNALERAQKRVEQRNFQIRKHVLEYDDVMNKQREVIYAQRREVLEQKDLRDTVLEMAGETLEEVMAEHLGADYQLDAGEASFFCARFAQAFPILLPPAEIQSRTKEELNEFLMEQLTRRYEDREKRFGVEVIRTLERFIVLQVVDKEWKDHLYAMDSLQEGIGLRAYGQRDPLVEYKKESFVVFEEMIKRIKRQIAEFAYKIEPSVAREEEEKSKVRPEELLTNRGDDGGVKLAPKRREHEKVGRNDPCPCGSGKKYKKCCGA